MGPRIKSFWANITNKLSRIEFGSYDLITRSFLTWKIKLFQYSKLQANEEL